MPNDYYVLAYEQASKERLEIQAKIDDLIARDEKLKRLVECLVEFLPAETTAAAQHPPRVAEARGIEPVHAH